MNHRALNPNETYAYGYNHGDTILNSPSIGDTTIIDQSVTYSNSSSDTTALKYRYSHIAKLDLEIIYKKISLGGGFRYNDFMKNIDKIFTDPLINEGIPGIFDGIPGINDAREKFKDGDFIIDARMGYQLNDMIRFGFVVNNLLNQEYMSRPANMMPPRTFAFQCSLKI